MKLRRNKKGFTIVELVIVIAVIGVLAAVLIPVFVNLTNKANKAADESLVKNLNTALATQEQEIGDTKNNTMHDAVLDLDAYGYKLPNLVTKSDEKLLWNQKTNRFLLEDRDQDVVNDSEYAKTDFWRIQNSITGDEIYSVYAGVDFKGNGLTEDIVNVKVGFDIGSCDKITTINYNRVANGVDDKQKVIIRTDGEDLFINAQNDTVNHYGEGQVLDIQAIADLSYHEFGHFPKATIKQGRMVVENGGEVEILNVTGSGVVLDTVGTGSVDLLYANSSDNIPTGTAEVETIVGTIDLDDIVARTEDGAYETLSDALDNLGASKTLYIVDDINETFVSSDYALYHINNELTLDGQGHTVNVEFVVNNTATKIFLEINVDTTIKNLNINSTGIKYVIVAAADVNMDKVTIEADNAGISAAQNDITSEFGHIVASNCTFKFTKGEHTRNDHQEAWAPVSTQYGGTVELFDCILTSSDGYGMLVWPSGGTLEATRCSITSAKGFGVAWARNGAGTSTISDSIIRVNNCTFIGSTTCEAKYSSSAGGTEAYVYKDGTLIASTTAN